MFSLHPGSRVKETAEQQGKVSTKKEGEREEVSWKSPHPKDTLLGTKQPLTSQR